MRKAFLIETDLVVDGCDARRRLLELALDVHPVDEQEFEPRWGWV
jgi:hypothetical protein